MLLFLYWHRAYERKVSWNPREVTVPLRALWPALLQDSIGWLYLPIRITPASWTVGATTSLGAVMACRLSLGSADPPLPFLWPGKGFLCSSYCVAEQRGPCLRAHITSSFLIYLPLINNLSLLALHCWFSLPRHAFINEFDLHWDITESIWGK